MEKLIEFIGIEGIVGALTVMVTVFLFGRWSKPSPKVAKTISLKEAFSSTEMIDKLAMESITAKALEDLNAIEITDRQFGEDLGNIRKFWRSARNIVPEKNGA